jgi:SAM-dependent methyltransferase
MESWEAFFDAHYVLTYAPLQPDDRSRAEALAAARLAEARRRRGAARGPTLVRADYRQIPLASGAFDAAFILHSSLGYADQDADRAVLREIRRVLRPGGRLLVETNHRDRLPARTPLREWYPLGGGAFLLSESRVDRGGGRSS